MAKLFTLGKHLNLSFTACSIQCLYPVICSMCISKVNLLCNLVYTFAIDTDLSSSTTLYRHSHSVCVANHYSMSLLLSGGLNERQLPYNDVFEITFAVDFQEAYVKRFAAVLE